MSTSANLALPFIEGGELLPDVTLNETLRLIDTLVQLAIVDRDLNAPPGSPTEGQRWIVKASPTPTGLWAGHGNHVAAWQDGGWVFCTPKPGWFAYVVDEGAMIAWNGTAWVDAMTAMTSLQNMTLLGLGTTADTTNPLSAKLNNTLWVAKTVAEGGDGHLRYKMSKESAAKTLSLLFQDNFSGRAEIGLTGDDDLHVKVSPDGATWFEVIKVDRNTGKVSFPVVGGPREQLAANRTYYVRTDGSDANSGLANTSGSALLTIQKAVDTVCALDLSIYQATIQIGDGTYTGAVVLKPYVGALPPIIQGNASTPANVIVSVTAADAIRNDGGGYWKIRDLKTQTTTSGALLFARNGAVDFQNVDLGASASWHLQCQGSGVLRATGNFAMSGNGLGMICQGGNLQLAGRTITFSNSPVWGFAGFCSTINGVFQADGMTFTNGGTVTGPRWMATTGGCLLTNSGAPNTYIPGNANGSNADGTGVVN